MSEIINLPVNYDSITLLNFTPTTIITTVGKDESINSAPMSWVTVVSYDPPQLLFSVNLKHDTYRNVLETGEFVVNIPGVNLIKEIWISQKHFPYGVNEIQMADLTFTSSDMVKPPKIVECKAHIECKVVWKKVIGSTCLVLGSIIAITTDKILEKLNLKERAIALKRLMYFSFRKVNKERIWMFAEIGKIHTIIEKDGKIKIKSENIENSK